MFEEFAPINKHTIVMHTIKDEYDDWRYNYPRIEAERTRERLDDLRDEEE